jgi:hypothetical protein
VRLSATLHLTVRIKAFQKSGSSSSSGVPEATAICQTEPGCVMSVRCATNEQETVHSAVLRWPSELQGDSLCAKGEGPPLQSRSAAAACHLQYASAVA